MNVEACFASSCRFWIVRNFISSQLMTTMIKNRWYWIKRNNNSSQITSIYDLKNILFTLSYRNFLNNRFKHRNRYPIRTSTISNYQLFLNSNDMCSLTFLYSDLMYLTTSNSNKNDMVASRYEWNSPTFHGIIVTRIKNYSFNQLLLPLKPFWLLKQNGSTPLAKRSSFHPPNSFGESCTARGERKLRYPASRYTKRTRSINRLDGATKPKITESSLSSLKSHCFYADGWLSSCTQ